MGDLADDRGGPGPAEFSRLQQQLVAVRARLDRQVSQLVRLNTLSDTLLGAAAGRPAAEVFAEAVVDVLDVAVGAVWIVPGAGGAVAPGWSAFGCAADWSRAGVRLVAELDPGRTAQVLDDPAGVGLVGEDLVGAMACRCVGRSGATSAVVVAANTATTAGNYEPVGEETAGMLALLADKVAAYLDNLADQQLIRAQLRRLSASEERLGLVLQGTNDGWWDWDLVADTCFTSARWAQLLGDPDGTADVRVGFWTDRVHPRDRATFEWTLHRALEGGSQGVEVEVRLQHDGGDHLPVLVRGTISRDDEGRAVRFAGSILDLSERKRHEAAVHRLAFYDPLTDLPNRRLLAERVQQEVQAALRSRRTCALLMLDLDRFKTLNDTHGHAAGDELLRAAARRLLGAVRSGDTVARLSGDEFVVLLTGTGDSAGEARDAAERTARKILEVMNEPYELAVGSVHRSTSIGVAVMAEPGLSVDTLLQRADVALYEAKGAGRNTVRIFEDQMQQRVDERSALDSRLHAGFERDEFHVVYQPQVDEHGHLYGAEALMRWAPSDGSGAGPAEFVPVAEETGFIHVLGAWVFEQVCRQVVAWRPHVPPGFRVAVNLSAPEFLHPDLPERIVATLQRTGARGSEIRLEITEATVVTEIDFVAERMDLLRAHGIEFSLDDFGTGYSSLTYLRRLPVSEVKIDRSYVARFLRNPHDEAIVRAVLTLCRTLDLRVMAEGVETDEQLAALRAEGCGYFQGFRFGRPAAASADPAALMAATTR